MRSLLLAHILAPLLVISEPVVVSIVEARSVVDYFNGCSALANVFPNKVFFSGSVVYVWENQNFWSNTELLSPECVFRPTDTSDIASAVKIIDHVGSKFAIRGGGHSMLFLIFGGSLHSYADGM
jgi:hypothetical protein